MIGPNLPITLAEPLEATVIFGRDSQRVVTVSGFTRSSGELRAWCRLRGEIGSTAERITSLVFSDRPDEIELYSVCCAVRVPAEPTWRDHADECPRKIAAERVDMDCVVCGRTMSYHPRLRPVTPMCSHHAALSAFDA